MKFELSEIGEIHCTLNFNEDWYNDYLQENGLSNSREILQDYVREECDYDIEYYDSETYHSMNEYDTMTIDEIEKNFGKALAHDVFNECMEKKGAAYVKAGIERDRLSKLKSQGINSTQKNGQTVDIDDELSRLDRQERTFGQSAASDFGKQLGSDGRRYSTSREDDRFILHGPAGTAISSPRGETRHFDNANPAQRQRGSQRNLDRYMDAVGALSAYRDEMTGESDAAIADNNRLRRNVAALNKYRKDMDDYKMRSADREREQRRFDSKPFFLKWGKQRPADIPKPEKPNWENDSDGNFDGYFRSNNPDDYDDYNDRIRSQREKNKARLNNYRNR